MASGVKQKSSLEPSKVMVVDSVGSALEYTSTRLREAGFKVLSVSRPGAAEPLFELFKPGAVVLSVDSASLGAATLELPRRLRQLSRGAVPIIYLVEEPTREARRLLLHKGRGADVFSKPVHGSELVAKLRTLISLQESARRRERMSLDHRMPSLHDPLTDLFNRRFLLALVEQEIRRCERYGGAFSLISCAVKNFDRLREHQGPAVANAALVETSKLIVKSIREADVAARVSESDLVVFLPVAPGEQVPAALFRLDARLQTIGAYQDPLCRPMVSVGSLSFPDVTGRPQELLAEVVKRGRRQAGSIDWRPVETAAS